MRAIFFIIGYLVCCYLGIWFGQRLVGIDLDDALQRAGELGGSIRTLLHAAPVIVVFVGSIVASAQVMSSPGVRQRPMKLFVYNLIAFGVGSAIVYSIGFVIIGSDACTAWARSVGEMNLKLLLFLVSPFAGVAGGTLLVMFLGRLFGGGQDAA